MVLKNFRLDDIELEKINKFTRRKLDKDEVYAFSVVLCDNEIDRDFECFSVDTLNQLSKLFIGKTGIFDHNPVGSNQTARIYDTEVCVDGKNSLGEDYVFIKAKAYMLSSQKQLIAEIDAGIKKEVSVSCSISSKKCSICGTSECNHVKGEYYDNKLCYDILQNATDAYEWSFVAIPAQKKAGVIKSFHKCNLIDDIITALKMTNNTAVKAMLEGLNKNELAEIEQIFSKSQATFQLAKENADDITQFKM